MPRPKPPAKGETPAAPRSEISLDDLASLKVTKSAAAVAGAVGRVSAIFSVKAPGYVPPRVKLRARIDDTMFTGEFDAADETHLKADPQVKSLEVAHRLAKID